MTDHPVHRDDITALRQEDDLKAYMRSLLRPTKKAATPGRRKPKRTWGAVPIPPDHKPGAWPPGTSPPGPAPERSLPPEAWADAVRRYRLAEENQCTTSATTSEPSSTTASPAGASPAPNGSPPHMS